MSDTRTPAQKRIDERVMNGVLALERKFGPDWLDKINLSNLDLSSPWACVLGQAYKDNKGEHGAGYDAGLEDFCGPDATYSARRIWSENHGFSTPDGYSSLTARWRKKIKELRAERSGK